MKRLPIIAVLTLLLAGVMPRSAPAQLWYQHTVGRFWATLPVSWGINWEVVAWPRDDRQAPRGVEFPADEWLPGMKGWVSPWGALEKLQRAGDTTPLERITYGLWGGGGIDPQRIPNSTLREIQRFTRRLPPPPLLSWLD